MGYTLAEKILMKNAGLSRIKPGDLIVVQPDCAASHDIYNCNLYKKLQEMGFKKLAHPERLVIFQDHLNPCCLPDDPRLETYAYKLMDEYGVTHFHNTGGITHQLMPELGYAKPGEVVVVTDSHTTTYGAVGCFSTGIGYTEMAYVWGTGELWFKVPETIRIRIDGELPEQVYAKDIALRVLGDLRAAGGTYKALEFCGSTIENLSVAGRMTIANMVVECGAKVGLFAADEKTAEFCKMPLEEIAWVKPDEDAHYAQTLTYKAEELQPVVACPPYVDNIKNLSEVEGTPITQVCLGSCTNGRLEDLKVAADILRGHRVAKFVKFVVTPASNSVMEEAMRLGYLQDLVAAGAMVTPPYCSFCEGRTVALLGDEDVMLGTNNRNFLGRYGSPKAKVYLCSPAVAAASAVAGKIAHPNKVKW